MYSVFPKDESLPQQTPSPSQRTPEIESDGRPLRSLTGERSVQMSRAASSVKQERSPGSVAFRDLFPEARGSRTGSPEEPTPVPPDVLKRLEVQSKTTEEIRDHIKMISSVYGRASAVGQLGFAIPPEVQSPPTPVKRGAFTPQSLGFSPLELEPTPSDKALQQSEVLQQRVPKASDSPSGQHNKPKSAANIDLAAVEVRSALPSPSPGGHTRDTSQTPAAVAGYTQHTQPMDETPQQARGLEPSAEDAKPAKMRHAEGSPSVMHSTPPQAPKAATLVVSKAAVPPIALVPAKDYSPLVLSVLPETPRLKQPIAAPTKPSTPRLQSVPQTMASSTSSISAPPKKLPASAGSAAISAHFNPAAAQLTAASLLRAPAASQLPTPQQSSLPTAQQSLSDSLLGLFFTRPAEQAHPVVAAQPQVEKARPSASEAILGERSMTSVQIEQSTFGAGDKTASRSLAGTPGSISAASLLGVPTPSMSHIRGIKSPNQTDSLLGGLLSSDAPSGSEDMLGGLVHSPADLFTGRLGATSDSTGNADRIPGEVTNYFDRYDIGVRTVNKDVRTSAGVVQSPAASRGYTPAGSVPVTGYNTPSLATVPASPDGDGSEAYGEDTVNTPDLELVGEEVRRARVARQQRMMERLHKRKNLMR